MSRAAWYAEGLRWIGSVLAGLADRLEANAARLAAVDPRVSREAEEYMQSVRTRVHIHF